MDVGNKSRETFSASRVTVGGAVLSVDVTNEIGLTAANISGSLVDNKTGKYISDYRGKFGYAQSESGAVIRDLKTIDGVIRSAVGIDCSNFVFQTLNASGYPVQKADIY